MQGCVEQLLTSAGPSTHACTHNAAAHVDDRYIQAQSQRMDASMDDNLCMAHGQGKAGSVDTLKQHWEHARCSARCQLRTSWPGVSRKVICLKSSAEGTSTVYAPMACVMPPASPTATRVLRMWSSSDVCASTTERHIILYPQHHDCCDCHNDMNAKLACAILQPNASNP